MSKIKTLLYILKNNPTKLKLAIFNNLYKLGVLNCLSDKTYLNLGFKAYMGKKLNLKNPQTFNEKLQWLKLYDRKREYVQMVDKYAVREYIQKTIGEEYLIPLLGIYNSVEEIDIDKLPNKFVLKCNHDSGSVVICKDKATFDFEKAKKKLKSKLKRDMFYFGREWAYKYVEKRIICEKYMEDNTNPELCDYKFYCFNGEPKFLYVSRGLSNHATANINYVSLEWEKEPFKRNDFAEFDVLPPKPKTFEQMVEFSKILSKDIPFLRVDFYDIDGKLYFGELTFFPGAGFTAFEPEEWDYKIGNWIKLK